MVQDVSGSPALTFTIAARSGATFAPGTNGSMVASQDGANYRIEGTLNLNAWTDTIAEISAIPPPAPNGTPPTGYEYHTFRTADPVNSTPADFIRVKVTESAAADSNS